MVATNIVTQNIRQSGLLKNIQESYYQAESGVEKILYSVRKLDTDISIGDCGIIDYNCSYDVNYPEELELYLYKDDSVQLDLYSPDNSGGGVKAITFEWTSGGYDQNTWLEVGLVELSATGYNWNEVGEMKKYLFSPDSVGVGSSQINSLFSTKNYKIKVKALYNDAVDLQMIAYNDNDLAASHKQSIAGTVELSTTGQAGSASQTINVTFPRYKTPQNIFDYVLFSEDALIK